MSEATGNRLKKVANELFNGNQSEMARTMGMSPQSANKYFQGDREPGIKMLKRLVSIGINATWVVAGIPPMRISDIKEAGITKVEVPKAAEEPKDYFSDFDQEGLNDAELRVLAEVKQFSSFLESRPLNPHIKRLLLELLIQSIDQALQQPPHDQDDN